MFLSEKSRWWTRFGKDKNVPWYVFKEGACRHPVGLYLSLSALLVFFVLVMFFGREKK